MVDRILEYVATTKDLCCVCHEAEPIQHGMCGDCFERLHFVNGTHDIDGDLCRYPLFYNNAFRALLKRYKFHADTALVEPFAEILSTHLMEKGMLDGVQWMCFVPMSLSRETKRGYNQAKLLAQELERLTGICVVHLFRKNRNTKEQNKSTLKERMKNLEGSFSFDVDRKGRVYAQRPSLKYDYLIPLGALKTEKGLVIDDFVTTGSTFRECKKLLDEHGIQAEYAAIASSHFPDAE